MKNKKVTITIVLIAILVVSVILYFFCKNNYKSINLGNNISKSEKSIEEYILSISSYEANITIEVKSNKNSNQYVAKQQYVEPNIFKQEIIQPENIQGLTTIYDGSSLKIENTDLNLTKIYEQYQYVADNALCLNSFISEYKDSTTKTCEEKENQVIMEIKNQNSKNQYIMGKKLYIDKSTRKPIKMEIEDINQNVLVYILYNEIKINSTKKEDILAFNMETINAEI